MSLVMAHRSKRSRNDLQSASISAVLPEPTGPPMPTRKGPCVCAHDRNSLVYCVSCCSDARSERQQAPPRSSSVDVLARRAAALDHRDERGQHTLAVRLTDHAEPHRCRHEIAGERQTR